MFVLGIIRYPYVLVFCVFIQNTSCCFFNPFKPNEISLYYQLDGSISNFRVVGLYFSFVFKF